MLKLHIFLVGMAGAGKTSLGKKIAQNLGIEFVDTDQRISEIFGMSIGEIFSSFGEELFRNAETGVLADLVSRPPCIVSTGGGMCNLPENVAIMRNHGVIVHIDRPIDQIISDIRMEKRPNLAGGSHEDVIDLYNRRIGYYRNCADYRLDNSKGYLTGVQNLFSIVDEIEKKYV